MGKAGEEHLRMFINDLALESYGSLFQSTTVDETPVRYPLLDNRRGKELLKLRNDILVNRAENVIALAMDLPIWVTKGRSVGPSESFVSGAAARFLHASRWCVVLAAVSITCHWWRNGLRWTRDDWKHYDVIASDRVLIFGRISSLFLSCNDASLLSIAVGKH